MKRYLSDKPSCAHLSQESLGHAYSWCTPRMPSRQRHAQTASSCVASFVGCTRLLFSRACWHSALVHRRVARDSQCASDFCLAFIQRMAGL
eukprot:7447593-Pyramimonas_sp.AAC.1